MLLVFGLAASIGFSACKGSKDAKESPEVAEECIDKSKINPDQACYKIYRPVCGCNGKTYSNDCMAKKEGVTKWTEGPCE